MRFWEEDCAGTSVMSTKVMFVVSETYLLKFGVLDPVSSDLCAVLLQVILGRQQVRSRDALLVLRQQACT